MKRVGGWSRIGIGAVDDAIGSSLARSWAQSRRTGECHVRRQLGGEARVVPLLYRVDSVGNRSGELGDDDEAALHAVSGE
jgi:hypothetical protein